MPPKFMYRKSVRSENWSYCASAANRDAEINAVMPSPLLAFTSAFALISLVPDLRKIAGARCGDKVVLRHACGR